LRRFPIRLISLRSVPVSSDIAETAPLTDPVVVALNDQFHGDPSMIELAAMYGKAYEENPAAFMGMLACSFAVTQDHVMRLSELLIPHLEKVQPYLENPESIKEIIMAGIPADSPIRMLLG